MTHDDDRLPDWAGFFGTVDRLRRFETDVEAYFAMQGVRITIDDGTVIPHGDSEQAQWRLGLSNVGQACAQEEDVRRWPAIVESHFASMERIAKEKAVVDAEIGDFEAVRSRLVIRLWDKELYAEVADVSVRREDLPGLVTILSLDYPESVRNVRFDEAKAWNREFTELFELALDQTASLADYEVHPIDTEEGATVHLLIGGSFYNASLAIRLEKLSELVGLHGAFVAVPTRNVLLVMRIDDAAAVGALGNFMVMAFNGYHEGPGSVSPRVWWWRGPADWLQIPYGLEDKDGQQTLNVAPPPELLALVASLGDGDDTDDPEPEDAPPAP